MRTLFFKLLQLLRNFPLKPPKKKARPPEYPGREWVFKTLNAARAARENKWQAPQ